MGQLWLINLNSLIYEIIPVYLCEWFSCALLSLCISFGLYVSVIIRFLSLCLSMYLSICLPTCLPEYVSGCLYIYRFFRLCACLSSYLSVCLSMYLPVCLSVCRSMYLSVCLFVCLSTYLYACLPVCLSVCVSLSLSVCLSVRLSMCISTYLFVGLFVYKQTTYPSRFCLFFFHQCFPLAHFLQNNFFLLSIFLYFQQSSSLSFLIFQLFLIICFKI